jgi:SAM-dependent methyltransferase
MEISLETLGTAGDLGALAHYADPAYYSLCYRDRRHDIDYYVRLAREHGGPVLEYGCGNGRITVALAQAGVSVVGVDLSAPMLMDLEKRLSGLPKTVRERVELVRGDMREARLPRQFPLVIAPFNAFLHLYQRVDAQAFLARVTEHLAPGGLFVFDVTVPRPEDLCRDPDERFEAPRFQHPETKQWIRYFERAEYDPIRQLLLTWMEFEPEDGSEPWVIPLTHRQFFPCEIEGLLAYGGFSEVRTFSDFTEIPPDAHTDSMVLHCRREPTSG